MFKSIGFVIALYAVSQIMAGTFQALERAAVASLSTIETAAVVGESQLKKASTK